MDSTLTPAAFVEKWRGVTTTKKASSQSHFIDLCRMLGVPTPHEADPTGEHYAFEKRVTKGGGGDGFANVWKRDFFAWEYKGTKADLKAPYRELLDYREDLENPSGNARRRKGGSDRCVPGLHVTASIARAIKE